MPFAAITYDVKPGFETEITEVFRGFRRVRTPVVADASGRPEATILSTAVFIRDATLVRVIEYEGDLDAVARFMASQPGVRDFEERIRPYLSRPRDTATTEGFVATFHRSLLNPVVQFSVRDRAAAGS